MEINFWVKCIKGDGLFVKKNNYYPVIDEVEYEYRLISNDGYKVYIHKSRLEKITANLTNENSHIDTTYEQ